jgi:hypothetical protein
MKLIMENWRIYLSEEKSKLGVKRQHVDVKSISPMGKDVEQDVVQLVKTAYADKGGYPSLETVSGLKSSITNYYLIDIDEDPEPEAGVLYYDDNTNKKASAVVHDGTREAKAIVPQTMKKLLSKPGHWIEVSGAPAHILINKLGLSPVKDPELAKYLVNFGGKRDTDFEWLGTTDTNSIGGDGWYRRTHGSKKIIKTIIGNVTRKMFFKEAYK